MESIVPDALPDISRIVESSGTVFLRQKEAVDGSLRLTGSVRASVFYFPEGGGELCSMTVNIPFLCSGDHPVIRNNSPARVWARVISADARALNPRKVLVRVELGIGVSVYGEECAEICAQVKCAGESDVQTLVETHRDFAVLCAVEKSVTFSDVLSLSAVRPQVRGNLGCRADIICGEAKAIGKRLVVKGTAVIHMPYLCEGGVACTRFELPFSQIIDASAAMEECEVTAEAVLTGLHCEEKNEGELEVTVEALIQAVVQQERSVSMVADLYSTARPLEVKRERVQLHRLLEQGTQRQMVRQFCPSQRGVKQVVECRAAVGETNVVPDGETSGMATAKVYVSILFYSEEDTLHSAAFTVSANCGIPGFKGVKCTCGCTLAGECLASAVSGGFEVRFEALFSYLYVQNVEADTVAVVRPGQRIEGDGPRPSLKIRAAEAGERLWDIAKSCDSTVADICAANDLVGETLTKGMLLLVPRRK